MTTLQNENAHTFEETMKFLNEFYKSCLKFWKREKQNNSHMYKEEINVVKNALKEVSNITTNPFSPNGRPLNLNAKEEFLKMEMRYCNKCQTEVSKSDLEEYAYQCYECDEDLYEMETHTK